MALMSEYYYLVSSLPMLMLGDAPQLSSDQYMMACSDWLPKEKMAILTRLSLVPDEKSSPISGDVIEKWNEWETCLRNRIVRQRASDLGKDAEKYTRNEKNWFSEIENGVQEAFAGRNPAEKEKILDRIRWAFLDNLEANHLFDFGRLCVYKLKLMILEKWQERNKEKGEENLHQIIEKVYKIEEENTEKALVLSKNQ